MSSYADTERTPRPPSRFDLLWPPCGPATPTVTPSPQPGDATPLLQLLGTTLRHYRQQAGLSQPALAARTGLNPTYIGQIEHGQRNVSVLSLLRMAEALGISLSALLTPL